MHYVNSSKYFVLDWILMNKCNYDCMYCSDGLKDGSYPAPNDIEKMVNFVSSIGISKPIMFVLSGGEVVIWKQLIAFVKLLKETFPNCHIKLLTNGSASHNWWTKNGKYFDSVQFSLHVAETKSLNKFIESIEKCSCGDKSIQVLFDQTMFNESIQDYNAVCDKSSSAHTIMAKPVDNRAVLMPIYTEDQVRIIKESKLYKSKQKLEPNTFKIVEEGKETFVDPYELILTDSNYWKGWECNIGVEKMSFRVNGEITRGSACRVGGSLGNWRQYIFTGDVNKPVICTKDYCNCVPDIKVSRRPVNE